jgi:hypothetical protein
MMMEITRRSRRGQALVETALVVVPLVLLALGTIQFGYSFMQLNMITNAARDGARQAAAFPQRNGCGCLRPADVSLITDATTGTVLREIRNVMDTTGFSVNVQQLTGGAVTPLCSGGCPCTSVPCTPVGSSPPTVRVTVTGDVQYLFRLSTSGTGFHVNKVVEFRDELRSQAGG